MKRLKAVVIFLFLFIFMDSYPQEINQHSKGTICYFVPLKYWEPENDNGDYNSLNWERFTNTSVINLLCNNLKQWQKNGTTIQIGISEMPDWMNPDPLIISRYPKCTEPINELVESACAFLVHLRDKYNVSVQSLVYKLPDNEGRFLLRKASRKEEIVQKTRAMMDRLGLDATIVVRESGEEGNTKNMVKLLPDRFDISQNYPNPFNPMTQIQYQLSGDAEVKIDIYDILGRRVRILMKDKQQAGYYNLKWDGTNDQGMRLASGMYIYRIQANAKEKMFVKSKKMTLLK